MFKGDTRSFRQKLILRPEVAWGFVHIGLGSNHQGETLGRGWLIMSLEKPFFGG